MLCIVPAANSDASIQPFLTLWANSFDNSVHGLSRFTWMHIVTFADLVFN